MINHYIHSVSLTSKQNSAIQHTMFIYSQAKEVESQGRRVRIVFKWVIHKTRCMTRNTWIYVVRVVSHIICVILTIVINSNERDWESEESRWGEHVTVKQWTHEEFRARQWLSLCKTVSMKKTCVIDLTPPLGSSSSSALSMQPLKQSWLKQEYNKNLLSFSLGRFKWFIHTLSVKYWLYNWTVHVVH